MKNNVKNKSFDAVAMKRELQQKAEEKLALFSDQQQIEFLHTKFSFKEEKNKRKKYDNKSYHVPMLVHENS
ncbi:MAG: hypothetical protein HYZ34_07960 [Ignavibacteriae bacterium]|nr:hypothetical protein [Ignavibacteriota bacterium]